MDKYNANINWVNELKVLKKIKTQQQHNEKLQQEKQEEEDRNLLELTKYYGGYLGNIEVSDAEEDDFVKKPMNGILLFCVIAASVFAGGYILKGVMAGMTPIALKKTENENSVLAFSDKKDVDGNKSHKETILVTYQNGIASNGNMDRYMQLKSGQYAKTKAEKAKKEMAFKSFYKKPEDCISPINNEIKIRCINEHIRARKQFNLTYQE